MVSIGSQESLKIEEEGRRVVQRDAPGEEALKIQSERGPNPPFAGLEDEGAMRQGMRGSLEARNHLLSRK